MMVLAGRIEQWWRRWIGLDGGLAGARVRWSSARATCRRRTWRGRRTQGWPRPIRRRGRARIWVFERARHVDGVPRGAAAGEPAGRADPVAGAGAGRERADVLPAAAGARAGGARAAGGRARPAGGRRRGGRRWRRTCRKLLLRRHAAAGQADGGAGRIVAGIAGLDHSGSPRQAPRRSVGIAARVALWQNQGETS